jgi:hypothetical protein
LVATTIASSQYAGVASVENPYQSSGMALTGENLVSVNQSAGEGTILCKEENNAKALRIRNDTDV